MSEQQSFYISTAIPYVNASPHIGFALELVQADAVARYRRQCGDDVFFVTGTDENSLKNVQAAEKAGMETQAFVDQNTQRFIDLVDVLNADVTEFIRTTSKKHFAGAQKLWSMCKDEDIYTKSYKGLYCVGCEQFYALDELEDGKCPEHQTVPEEIEEENYFFKLSNYQQQLIDLIERDEYQIVPETRKNEVLSFIKGGLEDFSISRSQERAKHWGVPVPGDNSQVMYVWVDALSNYITVLDFEHDSERYRKYWVNNDKVVHAIGKGIIRFHAVYWPAILLSAGVPLPSTLLVHEYINVDGIKMSKSLGNVVDPFVVVSEFGTDVTRYYLLRYMNPFKDSSFSFDHLKEVYTADLSNGLGNLLNRVTGLIEQNNISIELKTVADANEAVDGAMAGYHFDQALKHIWSLVAIADGYISEHEPWKLAKEGKTDELTVVLQNAAQQLLQIGYLLQPFMPDTAQAIIAALTADKITKGEPLFPRLAS